MFQGFKAEHHVHAGVGQGGWREHCPVCRKAAFAHDCAAQGKNRLFTGGPQPGLKLIWAFYTPGLLSIVSEYFQVS